MVRVVKKMIPFRIKTRPLDQTIPRCESFNPVATRHLPIKR